MIIILIILLNLSLLHDSVKYEGPDAKRWKLVWEDNFDGKSLDTTRWTPRIGNGCPELCGWGNNEKQYYTDRPENLSVSNGFLRIIAQEEFFDKYSYTSARIRTKGKGNWTYGKFEARIKLPEGKGIWPAYWMLPTSNTYGNWPKSGEIDIMELVGHEPNKVHGTIHYGGFWPKNKHRGESFTLPSAKFSDDFHVFVVEWQKNKIQWYVDGQLYSTQNRKDIAPESWPFDQPFHLVFNVAVGGNWPGPPDEETRFPQEMVIDYVRVYQ